MADLEKHVPTTSISSPQRFDPVDQRLVGRLIGKMGKRKPEVTGREMKAGVVNRNEARAVPTLTELMQR